MKVKQDRKPFLPCHLLCNTPFLLQDIIAEAQNEYLGNCQKNEKLCKLFYDCIFSSQDSGCVCVWSRGSLTNETIFFLLLDLKAVL